MKTFLLCVLLIITFSCQHHEKSTKRFDKKSLTEHYKTKNFNLLILWDERIRHADDEGILSTQLKNYLKEILDNNQVRILIAGLDGNPPYFFISSQSKDLPNEYSSLFYSVDKLNLQKFERHYNPNISILKSIKELITNYSHKNFFLPENDFMVMVLTTQDDQNYSINMQGQKYQDKLDLDIKSLIDLPKSSWSIGQGLHHDFTFNQLRLFVMAPTSSCHKTFSAADKLFYAANKINSHFTKDDDNWKREIENYNICNLNFKNYFNQIHQVIDLRYEYKLKSKII